MILESLRAALPSIRSCHFLDYAATSPMLNSSAEAMAAIARQGTEPLALHFNSWLALVESVRRSIGDMIHALPEEITFTTNTSTALSLVAASIRWRPGDRVLYPADEFPSNRYVWRNLADTGVRCEEIEPVPNIEFAQQLSRLNLDRVRLVALSAVSYRDGRRADVAAVVKLCRERGILVAVDAIQAVGAVPVYIDEWACDFLACGGQKWLLGPVGSGFLYVSSRLMDELRVPLVGWASSRDAGDFELRELTFCDGMRRFEPGLPDVAAIAALGKSIELLSATGWKTIYRRIADHNARIREGLASIGFEPLHDGAPDSQSGIVTVSLRSDEEASAISEGCGRRRIMATHRNRMLRVAAHATTTQTDIDALLEVLREQRGTCRRSPALLRQRAQPLDASDSRHGNTTSEQKWREAMVTGASRGLGTGIAKALARRGCNVTLIGRDGDSLTSVGEEIARDYGVRARPMVLDLSDATAVQNWMKVHEEEVSTFDVLANNAALMEARQFLQTDPVRLRSAFETNFFTAVVLSRGILPGMLRRGHGAILNVVTSGARCALPMFSGYASSKGALWAWSEALARELSGTGVVVSSFLPPHMETTGQRRLARYALSYYKLADSTSPLHSPLDVGERAIAALARKRSTIVSLAGRLKLAANALAPEIVTRRVGRVWRGIHT